MNDNDNKNTALQFLENFILDFSDLCGGLRLAALHISPSRFADQDERDAHKLLGLMLTGLERLEQTLDERISAMLKAESV